jgi:hypothetical protein
LDSVVYAAVVESVDSVAPSESVGASPVGAAHAAMESIIVPAAIQTLRLLNPCILFLGFLAGFSSDPTGEAVS